MIVCDVDYTFFSAVTFFRAVNHRVNHLAHSDAGTFRSVAHVRGNNSSRNVEPSRILARLPLSTNIGNINATAGFLGIVASNLAARNGDMGAVIGSKPSAAMTTIAIRATEFSVFVVSDIATRNGHTAARSQDATAKAVDRIACVVAGNYAAGHLDCRVALSRFVIFIRIGGINVVLRKNASATRSTIASDYTTSYFKSRPTDAIL